VFCTVVVAAAEREQLPDLPELQVVAAVRAESSRQALPDHQTLVVVEVELAKVLSPRLATLEDRVAQVSSLFVM
jgi:hypothetical protein